MVSPWWQLRGASSSSVLVTLRLPQGLCDVPAARAEVAPGALHSPALAAAAARADPAFPPRSSVVLPGPRCPAPLPDWPNGPRGGERQPPAGAFCPPLRPWQRARRRGGLGSVGADSGRSVRTARRQGPAGTGAGLRAPRRGSGAGAGSAGLGREGGGVRRCES